MPRVLAIADDLSGAAEIAAIGARHGLAARLERDLVECPTVPAASASPPIERQRRSVLVIDTDTRLLDPDIAADAVRRAVRHLRPAEFDLVYKKTDSVLRGPILAEVEAIAEELKRDAVLLVAQNPSRGRTIRDGEYRIGGVPLHETAFAHDPEYPARSSKAAELLGRSHRRHAPQCLPATTSELPTTGGVFVGEAESDEQVREWAERVARRSTSPVLPAGGADFFAALLRQRGLEAAKPPIERIPPGRTLFVCGSASAYTSELVTRAERERIPVCPMPGHTAGAAALIENWRADVCRALDVAGRALVVFARPLDRTPGAPQRMQAALAELVARVLASHDADKLMLEGGATASAVCRKMGWNHFEVDGELASGVVQMRVLDPEAGIGRRIYIKPGSYAWPEAVWAT